MNTKYISGQISNLPKPIYTQLFNEKEASLTGLIANPVKFCAPLEPHDPTWTDYMILCLIVLCLCDEVHLLPNWENSNGAKIEVFWAKFLNLKIIYPCNH